MATIAKLMVELGLDSASMDKGLSGAKSKLSSLTALGGAMAGIGGAITGAFGLGIKTAADFEQEMSAVGSVVGATGKELDDLRGLALQLGKDTSFSASEAAQAMEELGKAGVSTTDIIKGAAAGAVALAAAAGESLPAAADQIAGTLNVFKLGGDQATHVADLFAAAANKSRADAAGLAEGISNAASVFNLLGIPVESAVGVLALFNDQGILGAEAGTALRSSMLALIHPTQTQADLMAELGISVFDANGQFVGFDNLAGQLQTSMKGMTDQQKAANLAILGGSYGIQGLNVLMKAGKEGVDDYTKSVNDQGAAARAAQQRLDNFKGSFEQMKGSIETLSIIIGTIFLPALRLLVDDFTHLLNIVIGLPHPLIVFVSIVGSLTGAVLALAGGFILLLPKLLAVRESFLLLKPEILGLSGPILALIAVIALLGVAYETNFLGFADAVHWAAKQVKAALGAIVGVFTGYIASVKKTYEDFRKSTFDKFVPMMSGFGGVITQSTGHMGRFAAIMKTAAVVLRQFTGIDASGAFDHITRAVYGVINAVKSAVAIFITARKIGTGFFDSLGIAAGNLFYKLQTGIAIVDAVLATLNKGVQWLIGALKKGAEFAQSFAHFMQLVAKGGAVSTDQFKRLGQPLRAVLLLFGQGVNLLRRFEVAWTKLGALAAFKTLPQSIRMIGRAFSTLLRSMGLDDTARAVKTFFYDLSYLTNNLVKLVNDLVNGDWADAWTHFQNVVKKAVDLYTDQIAILPALLKDAFDLIPWDAIGALVTKGFSAALDLAKKVDWNAVALAAWNGLKSALTALAQAGIDIGTAVIDGALAIGGTLLSIAADVGGWLWGQLKGNYQGALEVGAILLDGALGLGGRLLDISGRFVSWLYEHVIGPAWGGLLNIGAVVINGAPALGGTLLETAGRFASWLYSELAAGWNGVLNIGDVAINGNAKKSDAFTVSDAASAIGDAVVSAVGALGDLGGRVASAIADRVTSITPGEWASFITTDSFQFGNSLGVAAHGAILAAIEFPTQVGEAIGEALQNVDLSNAAQAIFTGFGKAIVAANAAALGVAVAIGNAILGFLVGAVAGPDGQKAFTDFITGIITGISSAAIAAAAWPSLLRQQGAAVISGLAQGFSDTWNLVTTAITNAIAWILAQFLQSPAWLNPAGQNIITGLANGMAAAWSKVTSAITNAIGWILSQFLGSGSWLGSSGFNIIAGLAQGMGKAFPLVRGELQGIISQILSSFGGAGSWLYGVGVSIVQGMANGLYAGADLVRSAVGYLTSLIPDTIKNLLGIGSPSKVMQDLFFHVPEGAALGIRDGIGLIQRASGQLASAAIAPPMATIPAYANGGLAAFAGGSSSSATNNYGGITINVNGSGNPKETADAVFAVFSRELGLR